MIEARGRTASEGVAAGPAFVLSSPSGRTDSVRAEDPRTELQRIEGAVLRTRTRLEELKANAARTVGADAADILDVQLMMLDDPDYREMITALVREEGCSAETAVRRTGEHFAQTFVETGDDCLQARAADVRDVSSLLATCLSDAESHLAVTEPSVLVADEIVPSELMRIESRLILATVSRKGSVNAHASILARSLGIPAVVNAEFDLNEIRSGQQTLVDGTEGRVVFEPDEQTMASYSDKVADRPTDHRTKLVERYAGKVELCVNIAGPDDLVRGLPPPFAGVGLFRTEFLYLGRPDLPDEEEQYRVYRRTLECVGGRKVVVRTFDLGADKTAEALPCAKEANPALGCRGIRLALAHQDVFRVQLRALFRAATCGDLRIMYPMITSGEEIVRIKALVAEVAGDLARAGVPHRVPPQGVMIETPAAALVSDELAGMVDFFSIGTNDLTQYTLAVDREGGDVSEVFRPHHPAVLKLIRMTAENAHHAGIPVSICGELAADIELAETFLDMRIDTLSV